MALTLAVVVVSIPQTHLIPAPSALWSRAPLAAAASTSNPLDIEPWDCTTSAVIADGSASLDIFGLDIGPELSFDADHQADETWKASITIGGKIGLKIGESAHIKVARLVGGFAYSGAVDATMQKTAEYDGLSESDLLGLVSVSGLRSASRLDGVMAALSDLFQVGGSNQQTRGLSNQGDPLPVPSAEGLTVGGEFDGKLFFGATAAFSVELKGGGKFGISYDDDTVSVETVLTGSVSAELDSLTGSVGGELGGDATLSYTVARKPPYEPRSISFEATGTLVAIEGEGGSNEVHAPRVGPHPISLRELNKFRGFLRQHLGLSSASALTGAGISLQTGGSIQIQVSVDLVKHPQDIAVFSAFAAAVFAASTQDVTDDVERKLEDSARALAATVESDGTMHVLVYGTTKGEASIDLTFGAGFLSGVSLAASLTLKDLEIAAFRDPNQGFLRSTQCAA
jgi:hypothetical protein